MKTFFAQWPELCKAAEKSLEQDCEIASTFHEASTQAAFLSISAHQHDIEDVMWQQSTWLDVISRCTAPFSPSHTHRHAATSVSSLYQPSFFFTPLLISFTSIITNSQSWPGTHPQWPYQSNIIAHHHCISCSMCTPTPGLATTKPLPTYCSPGTAITSHASHRCDEITNFSCTAPLDNLLTIWSYSPTTSCIPVTFWCKSAHASGFPYFHHITLQLAGHLQDDWMAWSSVELLGTKGIGFIQRCPVSLGCMGGGCICWWSGTSTTVAPCWCWMGLPQRQANREE